MDKQLVSDIKELMDVVAGRNTAVTAKFEENGVNKFDAENLLREKLNKLYDPTDYYADDSSKKACFRLIAEDVAQQLPKRVEAQFGTFVEQQTVSKVGDKPRFKFKLGRKSLRKFVTKGSQSGTYRRGTMDRGYIDFDYYTLVGAVRLELREYLSGFMTMAELQEVILEEATVQLYADIQNMLKSIFDSLPAPNKHTTNGFVEKELDRIISTVSSYGDPVIFCTKRFASTIPTDLISAYDTKAIGDMHDKGYVQDYKGTKIVILDQSFVDESNEEKAVDDCYAYVLPTTKEAIIKVVFEGQMRIKETEAQGTDAKFWKFEQTVGMAIVYNNHVGIYRNVDLA